MFARSSLTILHTFRRPNCLAAGVGAQHSQDCSAWYDSTEFVAVKSPERRHPDDNEAKEDEGEFLLGVGAGGRIEVAAFSPSRAIWEDTTVMSCGIVPDGSEWKVEVSSC